MMLCDSFQRMLPRLPDRVVKDYSSEELADFRQRFQPIARSHILRRRVCYAAVAAFFSTLVLAFAVSPTARPAFLGALPYGFLLLLVAGIWARTPQCPACHQRLDHGFGRYCPECGAEALGPSGLMRAPQCASCGRFMPRSKSRKYLIRACTHCGIVLCDHGI